MTVHLLTKFPKLWRGNGQKLVENRQICIHGWIFQHIHLVEFDRTTKQIAKSNDIKVLYNAINDIDFIYIHKALCPAMAE